MERKHHPHINRITDNDKCFAVNGQAGAIIHLKRGRKYTFRVKQEANDYPQPFMFTSDLAGGVAGDACASNWQPGELPNTGPAVTNDTVVLDTKTLPKLFYYQSKNAKFLGGMVMVHG